MGIEEIIHNNFLGEAKYKYKYSLTILTMVGEVKG